MANVVNRPIGQELRRSVHVRRASPFVSLATTHHFPYLLPNPSPSPVFHLPLSRTISSSSLACPSSPSSLAPMRLRRKQPLHQCPPLNSLSQRSFISHTGMPLPSAPHFGIDDHPRRQATTFQGKISNLLALMLEPACRKLQQALVGAGKDIRKHHSGTTITCQYWNDSHHLLQPSSAGDGDVACSNRWSPPLASCNH